MPTEYFISRKIGDFVYCGCPPCGVLFQSLTAIISVFSSCGCVVFDTASVKIDHTTGITGALSAGVGTTNIGFAFMQAYADGDFTCATPVGVPSTAPVNLTITCLGPILFPEIDIGGFGPVFRSASGGGIGDIITNDLNCGSAPPPGEGIFGIVGSVQLFLP